MKRKIEDYFKIIPRNKSNNQVIKIDLDKKEEDDKKEEKKIMIDKEEKKKEGNLIIEEKKLELKIDTLKDYVQISNHCQVKVISPGFVLLKNALNIESQKKMIEFAVGAGNGLYGSTRSFWIERNGNKLLNSRKDRGRIYDAVHRYDQSESLLKFCELFVRLAKRFDEKMTDCKPSHLMILHYSGTKGINWHKDGGKNDGESDKPIISMSLGNSCEFGYQLFNKKQSGNVLSQNNHLIKQN
eukprot:TRINITY_DN768_c0_g1_i3.p1 TRINITY_DN768_c0_g1~~TRINITY_DN768_c0_g1_i3.p1  ORF type:complete len:241 (+),score=73.42 TRINITY_DN768_c0_g1_i3:60-782(+)